MKLSFHEEFVCNNYTCSRNPYGKCYNRLTKGLKEKASDGVNIYAIERIY